MFTDADVLFAPDTLRRALALAESRRIDHLALVPDVLTETPGERIFLSMFLLMFNAYAPPRKVSDFRSKVSAGVGAFNLVRAGSLRAIGGFRRLALSVDEDMRLGQALKYAGNRGAIVLGKGLVSVRWQVGLGGMIRGLEKNFFAGAEYRLSVVAVAVLAIIVIGMAPHAGVFVGPWWTRAVCALGVGAIASILALMRRPGGVAWYHGLLLPLGALACLVALVRSATLAVHRQGIRWRDHHYPLDELRPRPASGPVDAGSLALDALSAWSARFDWTPLGSVEDLDRVAIPREPRQRLERAADGPALPEPAGFRPDGDLGADDANLDLVHPITQRLVDLALDSPLQCRLGCGSVPGSAVIAD